MSSDMDKDCPLCMEPFDSADIHFYPCQCQYQICRFCWHRIRNDEDGLCPACRRRYPENPVNNQPVSENNDLQHVKPIAKALRQNGKQKPAAKNRKQSVNYKVLQNLGDSNTFQPTVSESSINSAADMLVVDTWTTNKSRRKRRSRRKSSTKETEKTPDMFFGFATKPSNDNANLKSSNPEAKPSSSTNFNQMMQSIKSEPTTQDLAKEIAKLSFKTAKPSYAHVTSQPAGSAHGSYAGAALSTSMFVEDSKPNSPTLSHHTASPSSPNSHISSPSSSKENLAQSHEAPDTAKTEEKIKVPPGYSLFELKLASKLFKKPISEIIKPSADIEKTRERARKYGEKLARDNDATVSASSTRRNSNPHLERFSRLAYADLDAASSSERDHWWLHNYSPSLGERSVWAGTPAAP